jgi:hypothetical protein
MMPAYKNRFRWPEFIEETIVDEQGAVVGTLRLKPSSVQWKPSGAHKFYTVALSAFADWITSPDTKAKRTLS